MRGYVGMPSCRQQPASEPSRTGVEGDKNASAHAAYRLGSANMGGNGGWAVCDASPIRFTGCAAAPRRVRPRDHGAHMDCLDSPYALLSFRPDSNRQSSASEADALSITPRNAMIIYILNPNLDDSDGNRIRMCSPSIISHDAEIVKTSAFLRHASRRCTHARMRAGL